MDVVNAIKQIDQLLNEYTFGQQPEELYQPLEYVLGLDPHRLYPILTLWGCYLFSGETKIALSPAVGVEIFYSFLKVHEEMLEKNSLQNKSESVHVKWNDNIAILSGDAMVFKAYELLIQVEPRLIKPVVRTFNQCFIKLCEGRQLALNNPKTANHPEVLSLNPGALVSFCLKMGSMIGGADLEQPEKAADLGQTINAFWTNVSDGTSNDAISQSLDELNCDQDRKQMLLLWVVDHKLQRVGL